MNCKYLLLPLDRKILSQYTDGSMQDKEVFLRIRQERTQFLTRYMPTGKINVISRAMGLASIDHIDSMEANAKMRRNCKELLFDPIAVGNKCLAVCRYPERKWRRLEELISPHPSH